MTGRTDWQPSAEEIAFGLARVEQASGVWIEEGDWQDESGEWQSKIKDDDAAYKFRVPVLDRNQLIERAKKYTDKMPRSVSGAGGHDAAWYVAQALVKGFGLSVDEALGPLQHFNARCQPGWSDKELQHKLSDADKKSRLPIGYILSRSPQYATGSTWTPPQYDGLDDEPVPTIRLDPPDEFPLGALPGPLQRYASSIAHSLDCPVDFAVIPIIAIAGAVIGNSRALTIKRGWSEAARFYMTVIAHPGSAKSPAERIVKKPVIRLQQKRSREWKEKKQVWEEQKAVYDAALKRNISKDAMPSNPGFMPCEPHIFTTDATTEMLQPMLQDNPRGVIYMCDELTAWIGGMNQYKGGNGRDRQFWLSAWSGEASKTDRKGSMDKGSIFVPRPFVNVVGGIQPDKVHELCKGGQDGFLDRILFSYPLTQPGAPWTDAQIDEDAEADWEKIVHWLYCLEMEDDPVDGFRPKYIGMTDDAKKVWRQWYNDHQAEMNQDGFGEALIGVWSKLRAYMARIALVVHLLRAACLNLTGEIDDETEDIGERINAKSMLCAAAIIEYFKSHLKRTYRHLGTTKTDAAVERVLKFAAKHSGKFTVEELIMGRYCKKASQAREIIKDMADRRLGTITWKKGRSGNDIAAGFTVANLHENLQKNANSQEQETQEVVAK